MNSFGLTTPHHSLVIARDLKTGEVYASRAGPSVQSLGGLAANSFMAYSMGGASIANGTGKATLGGYGMGKLYAQSDPYSNDFRDKRTSAMAYISIGKTSTPMATVKSQMRSFEISTNNANIAYSLRTNSNSYAYSLTSYLLPNNNIAPSMSTSVPGWDTRIGNRSWLYRNIQAPSGINSYPLSGPSVSLYSTYNSSSNWK